ncbi:MAG: hypothetical protein CTY35_03930 [Methylotenera sp.]|nr:MAG: hypothetical protein CTY35_03930 [Methylotenera sp.]
MVTATKTINPLPFEHLEPHRFEDLVRQLAYDFRNWNKLEATGRGGADDGFDARGWEVVVVETDTNPQEDSEEDNESEKLESDRIWLIQCKREKKITPAKLTTYLDDIPKDESTRPHGVLFVAACDFSKKARDTFISKCREIGINEFHLWGKAELEDMLYQPKNDHLLFAYFGISLQIRRRSLKTELRTKLANKRKAYRYLSDCTYSYVLLRDPAATHYPYTKQKDNPPELRPWEQYQFHKFSHQGVQFVCRRHFAILAEDGIRWDYAKKHDDAKVNLYDDPWAEDNSYNQDEKIRDNILEFWDKQPTANKAWLEVYGIVAYEDIFDIDKFGDDIVSQPHLYVPFCYQGEPFIGYIPELRTIETYNPREIYPKLEDRIQIFPEKYRNI